MEMEPGDETGRFRCLGSRVFVFELLGIHFDGLAFLLVGNLFEGSNVAGGTLLERFVAGNQDSSGLGAVMRGRMTLHCGGDALEGRRATGRA